MAKATQLRYLSLDDDSLADADLAPIASLVNLRCLAVLGGQKTITAAAYKYLANMTELEVLDGNLSDRSITFTDADLAHVSKLARLKTFGVRAEKVAKLSDRGLANLKGMADLEELQVTLTPEVTAESLTLISGLSKLRHLELTDPNDKPWPRAGIDKLLPLAGQLKVFAYSRTSFIESSPTAPAEAAWMGTVAKFTGLQKLELTQVGLADKDLAVLSGLAELRQLDLRRNPIAGPGLAHLKPLTKLEDLDLESTALSDASAAAIKELPLSVTTINVRGTKLTKPVLDDLEKSRKWKYFFR